ncbi:hypothetical protein F5Y09DRAFT_339377 [Xylaria sp. FL1042]|nr:hypothetical protein F5Y09DRAFT_339377 [Xylaria sp. FL1042]
MSSLTEFHYYPKLPPELQSMIWRIYNESLPTRRHHFHYDKYVNGFELRSYELYTQNGIQTTRFREKQDEFSLVHGVLVVPKSITFPDNPRAFGPPDFKRISSNCLAVNYEKDVFSFGVNADTPLTFGEAIVKLFGTPSPTMLDDNNKTSLPIKEGENQDVVDEAHQGIFLARRLAFHDSSSRETQPFPIFNDYDLQLLARFKRLKQIILVAKSIEDVPGSILRRAKSLPRYSGEVSGRYEIIGNLDSVEHEQLLKGCHTRVEVTYALGNNLPSAPLMGPDGPVYGKGFEPQEERGLLGTFLFFACANQGILYNRVSEDF